MLRACDACRSARDAAPAAARSAPAAVVVRPPQPSTRDSARGLSEALRDGAFTVIDGPVRLENMLEVLRRVVRRHYRDHWPAA